MQGWVGVQTCLDIDRVQSELRQPHHRDRMGGPYHGFLPQPRGPTPRAAGLQPSSPRSPLPHAELVKVRRYSFSLRHAPMWEEGARRRLDTSPPPSSSNGSAPPTPPRSSRRAAPPNPPPISIPTFLFFPIHQTARWAPPPFPLPATLPPRFPAVPDHLRVAPAEHKGPLRGRAREGGRKQASWIPTAQVPHHQHTWRNRSSSPPLPCNSGGAVGGPWRRRRPLPPPSSRKAWRRKCRPPRATSPACSANA